MIDSALMQNYFRTWSFFLALCFTSAQGAPLRYLGNIDFGFPGQTRTSIPLGHARAVSLKDGSVRFQGRDDEGRTWQAALMTNGNTTVWQSDFDHNSRPDMLIASEISQVGHCIDKVILSFLLFDQNGRPMPWVVAGLTPWRQSFRSRPAVFRWFNGRAEFVLSDCEWIDNHNGGEDRAITGTYEAEDTTWYLVRPDNLAPYAALIRRSYKMRPVDRLFPSQPATWPDQGNFFDKGEPQVTISAVLPASPECHGIRLPIGPDGRVFIDTSDPCKELGRDRIHLSNGNTCYGWPTVMLDRPGGREIVAETERKELEPLLRDIASKRYAIALAGQKELGRCSPVLLRARVRD